MLHVVRVNHLRDTIITPWLNESAVHTPVPSAVGPPSRYSLLQWLRQSIHLQGDVAEFGVYKGGTAYMMGKWLKGSGKKLHLFDTFDGMPEANKTYDNYFRKGDFSDTDLEAVRKLVADFDVTLHAGTFQQTTAAAEGKKFCFAHIDADLYESVLFATEFVYPRMPPGAVIVYDDYGWQDCAGAKIAVDEFYKNRPEKPILVRGHQAVVIKHA
jgi:O-methyltransferase